MTPTEKNGQGTVGAAPYPEIAFLVSRAIPAYPVTRIGSTKYTARLIAARFAVSPVIAREIAALSGIGGQP